MQAGRETQLTSGSRGNSIENSRDKSMSYSVEEA